MGLRVALLLISIVAAGCTATPAPAPAHEPTPTLDPALVQPRTSGGVVGVDMAAGRWSFTGAKPDMLAPTCSWFIKNAEGSVTASYAADPGGVAILTEGDTIIARGCGTWSYLGP